MRGSFTDSVGFSSAISGDLVLSSPSLFVWVGTRVRTRVDVFPACMRGASGGLPARV